MESSAFLLRGVSNTRYSSNLRGFQGSFLLDCWFQSMMFVILLQLMLFMSLGFTVTIRSVAVVWTGRALKQKGLNERHAQILAHSQSLSHKLSNVNVLS